MKQYEQWKGWFYNSYSIELLFVITIVLHCIALHCVLLRNDVELDSHGLQTRQLINQQISNISSLPFSNFVNV